LRQIPSNEHAYQQGKKCSHGCGVLKDLILKTNRQKKLHPLPRPVKGNCQPDFTTTASTAVNGEQG